MIEFLAAWGAGLSTVVALLQVRSSIRDRPRLKVAAHTRASGGQFEIVVDVVCRPGGLATSISSVGLLIEAPASIRKVDLSEDGGDGPPIHGQFAQILHSDVVFVEPGRQESFAITPQTIPRPVADVNELCRPFVADIEGRQVFGRRLPVFKKLVESGWQPLNVGDQDDPFKDSTFVLLTRTQIARLKARDKLRRAKAWIRRGHSSA